MANRKIIEYTIKLLSDTCCGNGVGNGSDVDVCSCFDKYGLPYIPAKRIRGLLRENADLLVKENKYSKESFEKVFGDSGKKSCLIVKNANIQNRESIIPAISKYNSNSVSAVFSDKRYQTKINDKGVAAKGSLRVIETVLKGNKFVGTILLENAEENDVKLVIDSFKLLHFIGMNKHRGLGEVCCTATIIKEVDGCSDFEYNKEAIEYELNYDIFLEQDIAFMLNSPMNNPNYIAGSSLQGAFASIMKSHPQFDAIFFNDLKFCNAYISNGKEEFEPTPFSFVTVKNVPQTVFDLASGYEKQDNIQYVPLGGYCSISKEIVEMLSVDEGFDFHINKGNCNRSENTFYNVKRISNGQLFKGHIYGSKSALENVIKAANTVDNRIHLGASESAQYGLCKLTFGEIQKKASNQSFKKDDCIIIKLLSDTIVINENGNNTTKVSDFVNCLGKDKFEVALDENGIKKIFAKSGIVGGYNAKWKMPKQQYFTIARGSTIVLECKEDVIIPEFVGINNDEGYGHICGTKLMKKEYHRNKVSLIDSSKASDCEEAKSIIEKIELNSRNKEVYVTALECAQDAYNNYSNNLSISAAMRIENLLLASGSNITKEEFSKNVSAFNKNVVLMNLSNQMITDYDTKEIQADMTELFFRTYIRRYKEIYQNTRNGGNDNE